MVPPRLARRTLLCLLLLPLAAHAQQNSPAQPTAAPLVRVLLSFLNLRYEELQYDLLVLQGREVQIDQEGGIPTAQDGVDKSASEGQTLTGPDTEIRARSLEYKRALFSKFSEITREQGEVQHEMEDVHHRIVELEAILSDKKTKP
jgi:hypothetical protein